MIQTVEVGTLFNIALMLLILTLIAVLVRLFRYPLSNLAQTINPFYHYKRLNQLSQRVEELETSSFDNQMSIRSTNRAIKKMNKRTKHHPKRKRSSKK